MSAPARWLVWRKRPRRAYKDVDAVVETVSGAGIARKVARLRPVAVIKGRNGQEVVASRLIGASLALVRVTSSWTGRRMFKPALPAGDVDLEECFSGCIDNDLEAAVDQRQGGNSTSLQPGQLLCIAFGGQEQLFFAGRACQRF